MRADILLEAFKSKSRSCVPVGETGAPSPCPRNPSRRNLCGEESAGVCRSYEEQSGANAIRRDGYRFAPRHPTKSIPAWSSQSSRRAQSPISCVGRITLRVIRRLALVAGLRGLWNGSGMGHGVGDGVGETAYNRERLYALRSACGASPRRDSRCGRPGGRIADEVRSYKIKSPSP